MFIGRAKISSGKKVLGIIRRRLKSSFVMRLIDCSKKASMKDIIKNIKNIKQIILATKTLDVSF